MVKRYQVVNDGVHEGTSRLARHQVIANSYGFRDG